MHSKNVLIRFLNFSDGLQVLIDGRPYDYESLTNDSLRLNGSVAVSRPQNNSFLVSFPSGIAVTVTDVKGALSIVFAAPKSFKNQTKGLLGTWNDDPEDDFSRPDGSTIPPSSTGREIHFQFAQLCKSLFSSFLVNPFCFWSVFSELYRE